MTNKTLGTYVYHVESLQIKDDPTNDLLVLNDGTVLMVTAMAIHLYSNHEAYEHRVSPIGTILRPLW